MSYEAERILESRIPASLLPKKVTHRRPAKDDRTESCYGSHIYDPVRPYRCLIEALLSDARQHLQASEERPALSCDLAPVGFGIFSWLEGYLGHSVVSGILGRRFGHSDV